MIVCIFCLVMALSFTHSKPDTGVPMAVAYFKANATEFALAAGSLQNALVKLNDDTATVLQARETLKVCRLQYKKIAFFLEYFFKSSALIYNSPPKFEIEEPYMEFREPTGLQVIESLLYEEHPVAKKQELLQQAEVVTSSAKDLGALLYGFTANDKQLLESAQQELIRVITLSITGFDAPLLKSGIEEAEMSLSAIHYVVQPYLGAAKEGDEVSKYLTTGIRFLHQHPDFDSFDRLHFLMTYALPLQRSLQAFIGELQLPLNTTSVLNYEAGDLFNPAYLKIIAFPGANDSSNQLKVAIGRRLFFDTGLSGNNKISCATCHQPDKHFTDGLTQSVAFDGHSHVQRNAPSLLYSAFQYRQFWDGKAESLQQQVKTVLFNVQEMNADSLLLETHLQQDTVYRKLLAATTGSMVDTLAACMAAYVRSLNPRNSRFDLYIGGKGPALTATEIKGFNLFMGKAQCGTCHFAPLFNGLTPPLYDRTEFEVLGTTRTDDLLKPESDPDMGRYPLFPMAYYKQAFKTPTVRNASATGPYMHNGAFKTLDAVVEFYNKGGAAGLKLPINNQTLSPLPLHLTADEAASIVSFMHTLEDEDNIQSGKK